MKSFEDVFTRYCEEVESKDKDTTHKPGQVREKFTEIIAAVGIDGNMLKSNIEEGDDIDAKLAAVTNATPYVIPDESVEFVLEILKKHISSEFKKIRRGDFQEASLEELIWLINGFTEMLVGLGYPKSQIMQQRALMEKRLDVRIHASLDDIKKACKEILEQAEKYSEFSVNLNYDDRSCFLPFIASSIRGLSDHLADVYSAYSDIRSDEIYDIAVGEADKISTEDIVLDMHESELIAADEELQGWISQRNIIVGEYGFVKNKLKDYNIVNERINQRLEQIHKQVYGTVVSPKDSIMTLMHPNRVLLESIMYVDETDETADKMRVDRLARTREQADFEAAEAKKFLAEFDASYRKRMEGE